MGAEIRRGHEIVGLYQDAQGVTVEVRSHAGNYQLGSSYVIGCDGAKRSAGYVPLRTPPCRAEVNDPHARPGSAGAPWRACHGPT
jgi:hypothetical protein